MFGVIIGDLIGSRFDGTAAVDGPLWTGAERLGEASVLSLAIAQALLREAPYYRGLRETAQYCLQSFGQRYSKAGYGLAFQKWLTMPMLAPCSSPSHETALRISPCAQAAHDLREAVELSVCVSAVTNDHPEGLRGAEAVAAAIYLAREGRAKAEIRHFFEMHYYDLPERLDTARAQDVDNQTNLEAVPAAFLAFFAAEDFESTLRNALSYGGKDGALAGMASSIAEAYYGVPASMRETALSFLDEPLRTLLETFEAAFPMGGGRTIS